MRLLDTNVLVKWGNPQEQHTVVPYLERHAEDRFVTSSLVMFEFFRPAKRRDNSGEVQAWLSRALDGVESFTEDTAMKAADAEGSLAEQNVNLPLRDLLIAAHADALGATFVTFDKGEFQSQPVQQLFDVDMLSDEGN